MIRYADMTEKQQLTARRVLYKFLAARGTTASSVLRAHIVYVGSLSNEHATAHGLPKADLHGIILHYGYANAINSFSWRHEQRGISYWEPLNLEWHRMVTRHGIK